MESGVFYNSNSVLVGKDIPYTIAKDLLQKSLKLVPSIENIVKGTDFPNLFVVGYGIAYDGKRRTVTDKEFAELLASESDAQFQERLDKVKSFDW